MAIHNTHLKHAQVMFLYAIVLEGNGISVLTDLYCAHPDTRLSNHISKDKSQSADRVDNVQSHSVGVGARMS